MDKKPVALAIDTSSAITSVALRRSGAAPVCLESENEDSHNEILSSCTDQVLAKGGCLYQDLSLLVLGAGPGSFTGLRIGFAFVKGLSVALGLPVIKLSSLKAYAASCWSGIEGDLIVALGDARRGEFFCSIFLGEGEDIVPIVEDQIFSGPEVERQLGIIEKERGINASSAMLVFSGARPPYDFKRPVHNPQGIAAGLCGLLEEEEELREGWENYRDFQSDEVMPNYVRRVAASTIAERLKEKRSKNQ